MKNVQQWACKGVWIPWTVWSNQGLSVTERVMLTAIWGLDNEDGCTASNGYFAEFFGLSISRVSEIIHGLVKRGYVKIYLKRGLGPNVGSGYLTERTLRVMPGIFEPKREGGGASENRRGSPENRRGSPENRKGSPEKASSISERNNKKNIPSTGLSLTGRPGPEETKEERTTRLQARRESLRRNGWRPELIDRLVPIQELVQEVVAGTKGGQE